MTQRFRLALGQLDPKVGDIAGNAAQARAAHARAAAMGADMLALPEMFLTGYQLQDLVWRRALVEAAEAALAALAPLTAGGPALGIGLPMMRDGAVFNSWAVLADGAVTARIVKHHLPNADVFDEKRVFAPGAVSGPFQIGPLRIGTPICEDAWYPDVTETLAETGAQMLLVPNGSPHARGKMDVRMGLMVARVVETGLPLIYLNLVGGQDDQVFDGASFGLNPGGVLAFQMPAFDTGLARVELAEGPEGWRIAPGAVAPLPDVIEYDYRAMVLGTADYLRKTGFERVLLGLSGGIDSALVATIAADAIGPANVRCVMLPSEYTSPASLEDAAAVALALGCPLDTVPIAGPRAAVADALAPHLDARAPGITGENIQSRLRGLMLMALSNETGAMLLTTGNKSEVAVGYATIYGDMAGGYNPIKDLYKTRVYQTCRWRNANHRDWMQGPAGAVIPARVIDKPPSAELAPDQRDDDSLPPYDILDPILEALVDRDARVAEIVAAGFNRDVVERVEKLIYLSEYKRFQSAPGPRLTTRAFWLDRRYPIVNGWRDRG
ncbi:MAG TPA: NAD+ synthase [Rhodobacteraceae bacterium]|nr:NAD+ synthase [Paracoccaceae bacterium]HBG98733.1 NAD+ synthase [Paracoccaceae bacterium]